MFNYSSNNHRADPDDYFSDTRMSFGDHLEDLRLHLWRAIAGFGVALIFGFFVGSTVLQFISAPVEKELRKYWERYYREKNLQIEDELAEGILHKGRPIRVEFKMSARALRKLVNPEPQSRWRELDIVPSVLPMLRRLQIEDWLDDLEETNDAWIDVPAKVTNPVQFLSAAKKFDTIVARSPTLSTLNVQEAFLVYFKVSLVAGFVLASPWIFYQVWSFIAAGMYPHEKKYVNVFLPVSIGLFLAGVFICEFFVIPKAIEALLWFNEWLRLEPDFRLNEWLSFAIFMPIVFGLSFQTPLVMLFVERIGIMTVDSFRAARKIAWFVMAVFAAIITPSTDAFSLLFLWVPMSLLYELGILLCRMSPQRQAFDLDVPESEELIEV